VRASSRFRRLGCSPCAPLQSVNGRDARHKQVALLARNILSLDMIVSPAAVAKLRLECQVFLSRALSTQVAAYCLRSYRRPVTRRFRCSQSSPGVSSAQSATLQAAFSAPADRGKAPPRGGARWGSLLAALARVTLGQCSSSRKRPTFARVVRAPRCAKRRPRNRSSWGIQSKTRKLPNAARSPNRWRVPRRAPTAATGIEFLAESLEVVRL
jgi:hypothetical protein